jgi:carboxylesterase type B
MDQEVVLVTLNYRLGALGFLGLGKESSGNYGLKDQVVALRWIQKNVEAFGGEPSSVTLYGYSAGSWSITLHMVVTFCGGNCRVVSSTRPFLAVDQLLDSGIYPTIS